MCVIAYKPKGIDMPDRFTLEMMYETNPDGAGFAYTDKDGKVVYKKGFMTFESLMKELEPLDQWKDTNVGLHFRIGTAGKNDKKTCHPFKISVKYKDLRQMSGKGKPVLFHNGVLDKGGVVGKYSSDTQDFVVAFAPMLKKYDRSKVRDDAINKYIGTSKLLVMYNNGKAKLYGDWEKDGDIFVSNRLYNYQGYYIPKVWKTPTWYKEDWYDEDFIEEGSYDDYFLRKVAQDNRNFELYGE